MSDEDAAAEAHCRVLIVAPAGRDAELAARVLGEANIASATCRDVEALCGELRVGAAAAVLTEEALGPAARAQLAEALRAQPLWADFPLVVLASPDDRRARAKLGAALAELGNVTLLDRPLHPGVLVSTVGAALRARTRQYQARELLSRLEAGVRERDHFLATLSHELRNPLGAIRNAIELVERAAPPTPDVQRPLAIVDRQVKHLARLIDDLLDVSRVTTGKVMLQRRLVDLRAVVQQAVQQLEAAFEQQRLELRSSLGSRPLWVDADPIRLEQVFTNLLTNAVKYTPVGGRVEVSAGGDRGPSCGDEVWVRVTDTGVGIAPDMLAGIFDLFAQADQSLDRAQGGMGIGLTLVRTLLALHGGTVSAASAGLGRGSEFMVRLPGAGAAASLAAAAASASLASARDGTGKRVLLVEDSDDNRELLRELLELDGFQVDVAANGRDAVAQAISSKPEAAVVDIGLPVMDGYEVARRVRAVLGDKILLVALTGYGQPEDRQRTADAGFDAHLTKPVDVGDLESVLLRSAGG